MRVVALPPRARRRIRVRPAAGLVPARGV